MNVVRKLLLVMPFLLIWSSTTVSGQQVTNSPQTVAALVTETFLLDISDIQAMCNELNITKAEFEKRFKAELIDLLPSENNKYQLYLTDSQSVETQEAIIAHFLEQYAQEKESFDFLSSFLVWNLFYIRNDLRLLPENPEEIDKIRVDIKNFCLNALASSNNKSEMPATISKTKKWMSADFWDQKLWHCAYSVASQMQEVETAWWWLNSSILILQDGIQNTNCDLFNICRSLTWVYLNRFSDTDDKYLQYYHLQIATQSEKLIESLNADIVKTVEDKYPGIDWKSPFSYGMYWNEYALANDNNLKDNRNFRRMQFSCLEKNCLEGRVTIIKKEEEPLYTVTTPNFNLMEMLLDSLLSTMQVKENQPGRSLDAIKRGFRYKVDGCLLKCHQFGRLQEGRKLYSKFNPYFLEHNQTKVAFQSYMLEMVKGHLRDTNRNDIHSTIINLFETSYILIAADKIQYGESMLQFSDLFYQETCKIFVFKKTEFEASREKAFHAVLQKMPSEYAIRLKNWETKRSTNKIPMENIK